MGALKGKGLKDFGTKDGWRASRDIPEAVWREVNDPRWPYALPQPTNKETPTC
jgi:hypothetical protein